MIQSRVWIMSSSSPFFGETGRTMTVNRAVWKFPSASVTVSEAEYVPGLEYTWVTAAWVDTVELSPKSHRYNAMPTLSEEPLASKNRGWPSSATRSPEPRAVGATVSRTVIVTEAASALPERSVTVRVAVYVPGVE